VLQAVAEEERQKRELEQEQHWLRNQGDEGVSEAPHKHGIADRLRAVRPAARRRAHRRPTFLTRTSGSASVSVALNMSKTG